MRTVRDRPLWRTGFLALAAVAVSGLASSDAAGAQATAGEATPRLEDVMPAELREPGLDPFGAGPSLQAHQLRGLTTQVVGLILSHPPGGDIDFEALAAPLRGHLSMGCVGISAGCGHDRGSG